MRPGGGSGPSRIPSDLPFAAAARRSALVLRLLTHSPTGAPVAAVTTSLPEVVGGERNWDYRYTWPRDASIGVAAFVGLGMTQEARMFLRWLLHASRLDRPRLPVLLTLDGRHAPPERRVEGWPGYRGSTPVRTGNGARRQHQLDGYGWVVDAAHVFDSGCAPIDGETWRAVAGFADFAAERWDQPDAGIWEERGEAQSPHPLNAHGMAGRGPGAEAGTHAPGEPETRAALGVRT